MSNPNPNTEHGRMERRQFPEGCKIVNIRRGEGARAKFIYAQLVDPDGFVIIQATLEYITRELDHAGIGGIEP